MTTTTELNAEEKALGAFLAAMSDCKLDGGRMRAAMIKVLGGPDSTYDRVLAKLRWALNVFEKTEPKHSNETLTYNGALKDLRQAIFLLPTAVPRSAAPESEKPWPFTGNAGPITDCDMKG